MVSLQKSTSMMLSWSVIIALMGCFVLSADAILCHQCNSHLEEDCHDLKLTVPRGVRDEQFLAECPPRNSSEKVFCRKTVTVINVNREKRVVRGCGWDTEDLHGRNDTCIVADNEGFTEEICACFSEGCNSAPLSGPSSVAVTLGAGALALVVAAIRRG